MQQTNKTADWEKRFDELFSDVEIEEFDPDWVVKRGTKYAYRSVAKELKAFIASELQEAVKKERDSIVEKINDALDAHLHSDDRLDLSELSKFYERMRELIASLSHSEGEQV